MLKRYAHILVQSFHKGHIRLLGWVCLYCFLLGSIAGLKWFAILTLFGGFSCLTAILIDADAQAWRDGPLIWYLEQEGEDRYTLLSKRQGVLFSEEHGTYRANHRYKAITLHDYKWECLDGKIEAALNEARDIFTNAVHGHTITMPKSFTVNLP